MNNSLLTSVSHYVVFFADSLFAGLKITIPLLVVFSVCGFKKLQPNIQICITSAIRLLVLGGLLFIYTISSNVFMSWRTGNEAERDMMIAFATGSHWYQFYFPLLNFAILPMMLWFSNARSSLYIAICIIIVWYVTGFYSDWKLNQEQSAMGFKNRFDYQGYFIRIGIFLMAFLISFGIEKWRFLKKDKIQMQNKKNMPNAVN